MQLIRNQQLKTSDINNLKLNNIIEECEKQTIHFIYVYTRTYDHILNTHKHLPRLIRYLQNDYCTFLN
jgi:predicted glycoside hydrolase/deacetylase ChbG (UPF0249 family)